LENFLNNNNDDDNKKETVYNTNKERVFFKRLEVLKRTFKRLMWMSFFSFFLQISSDAFSTKTTVVDKNNNNTSLPNTLL